MSSLLQKCHTKPLSLFFVFFLFVLKTIVILQNMLFEDRCAIFR